MSVRLHPFRVVTFAVVAAVASIAGCSSEVEDEEGLVDDGSQDPDVDDGTASSVASELGGCNQCSNCVLYARCRQPRLPYGLTYYSQKVARINSQRPHRGCVAVIKTSSVYGHVAYVNDVDGSRVHIDEGNWPSGHCGRRSGTAAALNIRGYICP